jgi:hypothetical protein
MKNRIFTHLTKMLLIALFFAMLSNVTKAQVAGDYRSKATGNWNAAATWESYDGSTWSAASSAPTATNNVYLQTGFTVTLTQNEACNDLNINVTSTALAIAANTLEISGKIRSYTGTLNTIPGTDANSTTTITTTGAGKAKFVGSTRNITNTGAWSSNPQGWDVEFAPATSGDVFTLNTGFKSANITVSSGKVVCNANLRPDGGSAGVGTLTIKSGATLECASASTSIQRVNAASASSHFGTFTIESGGTLKFSGSGNPTVGASTFVFNGTVEYSFAGVQILMTKGGNTAGANPGTYSSLKLSNSGAKTLGLSTTVNGTLTLAGTASLLLGASTLTYGASSSLEYAGSAIQTSTLTEFPASGVVNLIINNPNEVIVDATKTISGNATIYPLSNLTINASQTLNVGGNLLIQSDATGRGSLLDKGTLAVTGTSTVQNYLTGSGGSTPNGHYWYVGSPVTGALSGVFNAMGDNRLWYFNEVAGNYSEVITNGISLNVMQGFVARLGATETISFSGTLNTGDKTLALTATSPNTYEGFNLVCNPFPSAINLLNVTTTPTNLESTVWYRSGSTFATYDYLSQASVNGGTQFVPSMQSFWVKVTTGQTTGSVTLNQGARVHNAQSYYKTTSNPDFFVMNINDGTNTDETAVGFYQDAQNGFENYDSHKMFSNDAAQLYSLTNDLEKVAINGQTLMTANEERVIDLGFKTITAGTFTLNATNLNDFDPSISVYLEDVQQNVIQDLRQSATYTFSSAIVDDVNRFKIHFGNMITSVPTHTESAVSAYAVNNTIFVSTPKTAIVKVYDVLGNLIMNQQSAQGLNKLQMNVETGIYIVNIQTATETTTKKVMISK